MQLILNAAVAVAPDAAAADHCSCRAENGFKGRARSLWTFVTLYRDGEAFGDVLFGCTIVITKCRQRRTKDYRFGVLCGSSRIILDRVAKEFQIVADNFD